MSHFTQVYPPSLRVQIEPSQQFPHQHLYQQLLPQMYQIQDPQFLSASRLKLISQPALWYKSNKNYKPTKWRNSLPRIWNVSYTQTSYVMRWLISYTGARFAFDIYDFEGKARMDLFYLGDCLRGLNLNPTLKMIEKLGGTKKKGEKFLKLEEVIYYFGKIFFLKHDFSFTQSTKRLRTQKILDHLRTLLNVWSFMTKWRMAQWCWENWSIFCYLLVSFNVSFHIFQTLPTCFEHSKRSTKKILK